MLEQGYSRQHLHVPRRHQLRLDERSQHRRQGNYQPDVTSYDYDSALDEAAAPPPKYFAMRDVIAKATGITPPPVPKVAPAMSVPAVSLPQTASLWDNLPFAIRPRTSRAWSRSARPTGTSSTARTSKADASGELVLDQLHSYAQVYVNKSWSAPSTAA